VSDDLENLILRTIDRYMAGRHSKRYGKATSWDPDTHMAKVMLKPEGQESGWIPVHTMAAGDGYGHMSGIVTGDGVTTGEQLEITHQEGEFEAGSITARVHSTTAVPPKVESGEELFMSYFKQFIKMDKNGAITIQDKSGKASIVLDGSGNITINAAKYTLTGTSTVAINGQPVDVNS
jgi:phage baseplate assembly protein gpV